MTIKVDLLHSERHRRWRLDPLVLVLFALLLATNVALAFYGQRLTSQVADRQTEVRQIQDERRQIEASLPIIEERRNRVAHLVKQIASIHDLKNDPIRYANLLSELANRLPDNVWLSSLSIEPASNSVQFAGTAVQVPGRLPLATVAKLIRDLNESPRFSDAALTSTSASSGGFTFQLTVHYDPQAALEVKP